MLKNSANDDHRVRPHDVDDRVASEFRQIVDANDRILAATLELIHARFELDEIVNVRSSICGPVHLTDDATKRKSRLLVAAGQLLKLLEHVVLIEPAISQVGLGADSKLQWPASLGSGRVDSSGK